MPWLKNITFWHRWSKCALTMPLVNPGLSRWSFYSFKIFCRFLLPPILWLILHNQLAVTTFGRCEQLNLHGFELIDFVINPFLPKTCPALSWDQALLSFPLVKRFSAAKANRKISHNNSTCIPLHAHSRNCCDILKQLFAEKSNKL